MAVQEQQPDTIASGIGRISFPGQLYFLPGENKIPSRRKKIFI